MVCRRLHLVIKYIDNTAVTEPLHNRAKPPNVELFFQQLLSWTDNSDMVVNLSRTKEMVLGPSSATDYRQLRRNWKLAKLYSYESTLILIFLASTPPFLFGRICFVVLVTRKGGESSWSNPWHLRCTLEVFHVHKSQIQFIQPGWAECVFAYLA